ncbi:MAG: hypothetical protein JOY99_06750 [Sphingomonadaceae bacterium]|nr:hypothetical protein [Sphingomonadaceae bacterium]
MPQHQRIVAVGLLTATELARLGLGFDRAWPIDQTPCFDGLLRAIDEADRRLRQDHDDAEDEAPH